MRLTKKDVGAEFWVKEYRRGYTEKPAKKIKLESAGRVFLGFSNRKHRIISSDEFSIVATERHASDLHIAIYRSEDDVELSRELINNQTLISKSFSNYESRGKPKKLTLDQSRRVISIINE